MSRVLEYIDAIGVALVYAVHIAVILVTLTALIGGTIRILSTAFKKRCEVCNEEHCILSGKSALRGCSRVDTKVYEDIDQNKGI